MASWPYLRLFTKQRTRAGGYTTSTLFVFRRRARKTQSLRKAANGRTTQAKRRLHHAEPQVIRSIAQMFQCVNCFLFDYLRSYEKVCYIKMGSFSNTSLFALRLSQNI